MSEPRPTLKTGSKGPLKRLWLFLRAVFGVLIAWVFALMARIFIGAAMLILSVAIVGYMIFYGTRSAGMVIEDLASSIKKYRI